MARFLACVSGALAVCVASAAAQDFEGLDDILADDRANAEGDEEAVLEQPAPVSSNNGLSELDILSRSADDPFAGIIDDVEREPVSVRLRALNKITARYTDLEVEMGDLARFGSLEIVPRTCDTRPPEEFPETSAFLEIFDTNFGAQGSNLKIDTLKAASFSNDDQQNGAEDIAVAPITPATSEADATSPVTEGENIFRGWMFASSPALNPLEHAVYDVWVIDCNMRVLSN